MNSTANTSATESTDNSNPVPTPVVVGIGASSGGLTALKKLLSTIPQTSGVAYVIVVHLSPEHDSHLAELLQPSSPIPVTQVRNEIKIEADQVYVIPPGKNLNTIDSHLRISDLEPERRKRAPIDHFFRALAGTHDGNSVAIILTGTGPDGTLGIQEVKGMGGLTVVQDPLEAEYDGMPQSALSTGVIDLVLPLSDMISHILKFLSTKPRLFVPNDSEDARPALSKTLSIIRNQIGSDFTRYKQSTIMRRIQRRMQLSHIEEIKDYLDLLNTDSNEVTALANDFLINVTSFFRDQSVFDELEQKIIPELFRDKQSNDSVRVWSVGCASGEEAYSLAILLHEYAEKLQNPPQIQIFASDLHENSLKKAREGLYPGDIDVDVSNARLNKFFVKENGSYRIRTEIRDHIVFSPHNLLADPPFSRIDLVVCRNVLIYFQRTLQPDIIQLFHYSLKPRGFLVLGTAESINQTDLFITENKAKGIYLKRNVPCPESRLPVFPLTRSFGTGLNQTPQAVESLSYGALHHRLSERYAPASILINSDNKVVHLSPHAGRYLMHPGGTPTTTVFKLVREDLQAEVRSILHLVSDHNTSSSSRPIRLRIDGTLREITIRAYQDHHEGNNFTLLIFEEREPLATLEHTVNSTAIEGVAPRELEIELELTKRRLQTAIDEYEASQEEMRASNEELQSANEELRSTLEELETSKEELQSINEELQTANQENRHKVAELGQITDDLQHLMSATHIATLFLDRKFRILRFTPQVGELFNLRTMDRGRPISDLTHRLHYDELMTDATTVLEKLTPSDREVQDLRGNWYLARMRPYRTADDRIEGLVLTFVDITAHKESEIALRQSEERYRALFESMDEGFCVVEQVNTDTEPNFRIIVANPAFQKLTGLENAAGQNIKNIAPNQLPFWQDIFSRLDGDIQCKRFECVNDAFHRWLEVSSFRLSNVYGPHVAVLLKDIHEQKCIEEELRESGKRDAFRVAVADAFRTARAPNEIQEIGCRMLGEHFKVDNIIYSECNPDGETVNEHEYNAPQALVSGRFFPWQSNEILYEKFMSGQRLYVSNIEENHNLTAWQQTQCHSFGIRAFVSIPLVHDQLVALITVAHSRSLHLLEPDLLLVKEIAERIFDAVEIARSEQAIYQREMQLREADQCKNEFIAVLSHELRNPLAPILNALQVIEIVDPNSQTHVEAQAIVRRQVGLMSRLIDDLLDITRIAQGKIQLQTTKLELNRLINDALHDHLSVFEKNQLTLGLDPFPDALWINGDKSRLSQAIGNLLQNCAKFTSAGGTTHISISTTERQATIQIKDSGIGMTQDLIEKIFQPFIQGEATLERSKGGLGLGLALCKRLVELHDGTISAHSKGIGEGAEFRIELPLIDAPQHPVTQQARTSEITPRRILIIEDNADSAETLRTLLHHSGHEIAVADNGASGIGSAREFKPDFIICDIGLPVINGYDVASQIKSEEDLNKIILVALSGYAMPADIERAANAGFDYFLKKPADLKKLEEILIGDGATAKI